MNGHSADPPIPPILFLTGPTASGKTAVSLLLAERWGAEILSVDSRQIYRELQIGTAKPSAQERARITHHLLDRLGPREACSAGLYRDLYAQTLRDLSQRQRVCLAVGGTGLYWEACTRGLHWLPPVLPALRSRLEAVAIHEGVAELYRRLQELDPAGARRIPPQNRQRVMRALELVIQTQRPLADLYDGPRQGAVHGPIATFVLRRQRGDLYQRIDQRCDEMMESGLLEEVRALLAQGLGSEDPGMRSLGYRELAKCLRGDQDWERARTRFKERSRQYGKRQETWFRHRLAAAVEIEVESGEPPESVADRIETLHLASPPDPPRSRP